ncbi:MAG: zinc-binding dehydrogenase [Gemmatimonadetes bacterium]|nr:zinc-binding dehydrogenase [Gemmatimonadota bacterium]
MRTMTSALFYGSRDLRLEEVEIPAVAPGEALIRVEKALTCATDLKTYIRGGHKMIPTLPCPFGHEFAGTIHEIGEGTSGIEIGMPVVVANSAPCNDCPFCKRQQQNLCENLVFLNGAYSEYILVPEPIVSQNLYPLTGDVPFERMALMEPLACVLHGLDRTEVHPGDQIAVIGAGPIGLMWVRMLHLAGAEVTVLGRSRWKLEAAERLGAKYTLNVSEMDRPEFALMEITAGLGFDVVVEAVGVPEIWERAFAITRRGGTVHLFGGCEKGTTVPLDTHALHYDEKRVLSVFHHTPEHVAQAFDVLRKGDLDENILITQRVPLSELAEAFEQMERREALKICITP